MEHKHAYPAWLLSLGTAGMLCGIYRLFTTDSGGPIAPVFYILMAYGPVLWGAMDLFLRKERSIYGITALAGGMMVLTLVGCGLVIGYGTVRAAVGASLSYLIITVMTAYFSVVPTRQSHMITLLDLGVCILIILIGGLTLKGQPVVWALPAFVGVVCGLLGLFISTSHGRPEPRQWVFFLSLLALVSLLALLAAGSGAQTLGQGLVALWKGFLSLITALGHAFERFVTWLSRFFHRASYEPISAEAQETMGMGAPQGDGLNPNVGIALAILLGICAAGAGTFALALYGGHRLGIKRVGKAQKAASHRPGLLVALRLWFSRQRKRMGFLRLVRQRKNTPWGIYYHLILWTRRSPLAMRSGESPRMFLTRLMRLENAPEGWYDAFSSLIPLVDQRLFGRETEDVLFPQADYFHRTVKTALHRSNTQKTAPN